MKPISRNHKLAQARLWICALSLLLSANQLFAAEYEARLAWHGNVSLSTPVSGVVTTVVAQAGQKVKKGDLLLQLDQEVFKAAMDYAEANLRYHERLNKEAKQELDRNLELYERTVLSNHELEAAHIVFDKNTAALKKAQKEFAQARFNLNYSSVTAPFDGVVLKVLAVVGQTVLTSQGVVPLLEFASSQNMVARFNVSSGIGKVSLGKKVAVWVGKRKFKASITAVERDASSKTKGYRVEALFATKGRIYPVGRSAKVVTP